MHKIGVDFQCTCVFIMAITFYVHTVFRNLYAYILLIYHLHIHTDLMMIIEDEYINVLHVYLNK